MRSFRLQKLSTDLVRQARNQVRTAISLANLVGICLMSRTATSQTFEDFIALVNASPESLQTALVDSFVSANPVSPILEFDTLAHYYYRGTVTSVTIPGDANQWNPSTFPMGRLSTTNFWYRSVGFEADARLDYKYFLNGSAWILDPRNPFTVNGGFGPNSELRMPGFIQPPEITYDPAIAHGTVEDTTFFSTNLGNSRTIRVYTPPLYGPSGNEYGVVVFHDGLEYISLASAVNVIDFLIHHGRIEPVIAVFVPPVNRTEEYAGSLQDEFSAFLVEELLPWVDSRYNTTQDPTRRATLGASNGGNIALWLGLNYPDVFGNVAAHSSNIQTSISDGFENGPLLNLRLYMDLGTYDIPFLVTLVRDFIPILQSRGYDHTYAEFHDGHSWGNWRGHIDNALEEFFPGPALTAAEQSVFPPEFHLKQNYPNPFNPITEIEFEIGRSALVTLEVYDTIGRRVTTLWHSQLPAGRYTRTFKSSGLSSGIYFYRLTAGGSRQTRKMVLLR